MHTPILHGLLLIGITVGACAPGDCRAALGQQPTSLTAAPPFVGANAVAPVRRLAQRSSTAAWTLQEDRLGTGTTVQQLVRADGVVFAVFWSGPVLPDLGTLLGTYDSDFDAQLQQRRAQRLRGGTVAFSTERLVLRSAGRMRDFTGHAYVPSLVPAGVRMQDLLP